MEVEVLSLCSQRSPRGHYTQPDESGFRHHTPFIHVVPFLQDLRLKIYTQFLYLPCAIHILIASASTI
jgi:hypothetical protein